MWAPKIEQTEALKSELEYFLDCIENDETPFNDGVAGLRVVKIAGSGRRISEAERGDRSGMNDLPLHCAGRQAGAKRQALEIH